MTDTELLNRIEQDLFNGSQDYVHIYVSAGTFTVEMDGQHASGATLRAAFDKLFSESST
jgi:hypothetical protein